MWAERSSEVGDYCNGNGMMPQYSLYGSGMNGLEKKYNLVIVGAGLSGSVIAERASKLLGLKVSCGIESLHVFMYFLEPCD